MVAKDIRARLKKCQPYFIEKELLPNLYFKEEECDKLLDDNGNKRDVEYWIVKYAFMRKLSDEAIGIRLGFESLTIYRRTLKFIERNLAIIEEFLARHDK